MVFQSSNDVYMYLTADILSRKPPEKNKINIINTELHKQSKGYNTNEGEHQHNSRSLDLNVSIRYKHLLYSI